MKRTGPRIYLIASVLASLLAVIAADCAGEAAPSQPTPVGQAELRVLAPTWLELSLVTTKPPEAPPLHWDFVAADGTAQLPAPNSFTVKAGDSTLAVAHVGFKRRVLYAPLKQRDLRVVNSIYLDLVAPVPDGEAVELSSTVPPIARAISADLRPSNKTQSRPALRATNDPARWSPAIHVNQTGYAPAHPKRAMVGFYLGNLGELDVARALGTKPGVPPRFEIIDASGKTVQAGDLKPRPDRGFPYAAYQGVMEADFTDLRLPGEYRLRVPGLGVSFPFRIDGRTTGAFARTYALGLYHQRCGTANELPFTRFTHGPCHAAPAEVPSSDERYAAANHSLKNETEGCKDNPRHIAPRLDGVDASLYPFVNPGPVNVAGGHHDAGDYSKYTINSAGFIHHLVLASDILPGVGALDNLGLPESGDSKSDLLQEARWEADFLARMQDADGGFYFLVYPRGREYEDNVLPDQGDPQVVFPKTTAATAAAVAALAQCASSPLFKKQFPRESADYLEKARKGWAFLEGAIARHGKDGAYQKITHYGDEFMHDDELAWAATEMYLATHDPAIGEKLLQWLQPADPATRKWGWLRLYDAYGCAIRSFAFSTKTGRLAPGQADARLLRECQAELLSAAREQAERAASSAYGTSFPEETKRARSAGWYFSMDAAFDLAVASQLDHPAGNDPRPGWLEAIVSNLNYEQGCNPPNVVYLTGLGWKRQLEIVHQYAQNDRRALPPTGIPLGNIQEGMLWIGLYKDEPLKVSFPSDTSETAPFPFYDRWADAFNLSQEFVILQQARGLAVTSWLMAQGPLKNQTWRSAPATLAAGDTGGAYSFAVASELDLSEARIVWEAEGGTTVSGPTLKLGSRQPAWVEAEAQLPDGRRVFAVSELNPARRKSR